jgi:putative endonuclease
MAGTTSAMGAFVYMLRCSDDSFYVGSATGDDISRRIAEHNAGAYAGVVPFS